MRASPLPDVELESSIVKETASQGITPLTILRLHIDGYLPIIAAVTTINTVFEFLDAMKPTIHAIEFTPSALVLHDFEGLKRAST
jgi:hypothetical protein